MAVAAVTRRLAEADATWCGALEFADALARNEGDEAACRSDGRARLLLFEPARPVFTLGRRATTPAGCAALQATLDRCEQRAIPVLPAPRGGLGTLHLPGQLVAFVAVRCPRIALPGLVAELLGAAAAVAEQCGHTPTIGSGDRIGVWLAAGKIASIGLHEARGVAGHGLSLNVAITPALAPGLQLCGQTTTHFADLRSPPVPTPSVTAVAELFVAALAAHLRGR
jgi:lipoate-protein ligase B